MLVQTHSIQTRVCSCFLIVRKNVSAAANVNFRRTGIKTGQNTDEVCSCFLTCKVYIPTRRSRQKATFHETHLAHCAYRGLTRSGGIHWIGSLGGAERFPKVCRRSRCLL